MTHELIRKLKAADGRTAVQICSALCSKVGAYSPDRGDERVYNAVAAVDGCLADAHDIGLAAAMAGAADAYLASLRDERRSRLAAYLATLVVDAVVGGRFDDAWAMTAFAADNAASRRAGGRRLVADVIREFVPYEAIAKGAGLLDM